MNSKESFYKNIPQELIDVPQWVCYRLEEQERSKKAKVPYYPKTGSRAKLNDKSTWGSFQQAVAGIDKYDGIGFVFSSDDPYCGIDLDSCVVNGRIQTWAQKIINQFKSCTEFSPSGTGIHIFIKAKKPGKLCRKGKIEIYDQGRFFTITGNHVPGTPKKINNRQKELDKLYRNTFPSASSAHSQKSGCLSDDKILKRAENSNNGEKFNKLWGGDFSDYPSRSEADLALCYILVSLTNDADQIDRLFRRSGLMRDKWDEQRGEETYGQITIKQGIEGAKKSRNSTCPIFEKDGRLHKVKKRSGGKSEEIPITSFVIEPLESITIPNEGETIKATLKAQSKEFEFYLPSDCWSSQQKFLKILPAKETTFTGSGTDVQHIRNYISTFDMPHKRGIRTAGLHNGIFITEEGALSKDGISEDIVYFNEVKTDTKLISIQPANKDELAMIKDHITDFNVPTVVLPVIGWTTACFFKLTIMEVLNEMGLGYCFPLLNLQGEPGAGKTTTVENIVMRMWAIGHEPKSIGELTRFTMMKMVDGSNAIPVVMEENKSCLQNDYYRNLISNLIRSTYNSLEGERGKQDQTTQIYRYQAPVVIVGETGFVESALLDRLVVIFLSKRDSAPYLLNFQYLRRLPLEKLGRTILEKALRIEKAQIKQYLEEELGVIDKDLMDRPRTNTAVVRFGLRILGEILNMTFDLSMVDQAVKEGILEGDSPHRKSSVDKILEAMCVMAQYHEEGEYDLKRKIFSYQDHLDEGVDYEIKNDEGRLILWVSGVYPKFKKWARSHSFEGDLLTQNDFARQIKRESYCIDYNKSMCIAGIPRKCAVLDIQKMKDKGLELSGEWGLYEEP